MPEASAASGAHGDQPEALERFLAEGRRLRQRTLELTTKAVALADSFQIPPPGDAMKVAWERLSDDAYQILVVGEVKRGKTTLVNALTGLRLPTDVDIATSQVFRIGHADRLSYRVRYADGSERPIGEEDLARYGSQVVADAQGLPDPGRTIEWIEVGLPYTFLPRNVSLLDTPGVGGTVAGHAEITHRFLPRADAVLFVLDADRPLDELEIRILEAVLRSTRHVFFVQTKIDQSKESEWQAIRAKSQDLLKRHFGQRLADTTIWPISSLLLQKAASAEAYADFRLIQSRHREFAPALSAFLYRVVGWSRAADAVLLAEHFHRDSMDLLATRHRSLADTTRRAAEEFRGRLQHARRVVDEASSGFNRSRGLALDRLRDEARRSLHWLEDQIGDLEQELRAEIDAVKSVDAARALGAGLGDAVLNRASEVWQDIRRDASDLYASLLADLLIEAEEELRITERTTPRLSTPEPKIEGDFLNRVNVARNHAISAGFTVGVPAAVLVSAGILAPPIAVIAGTVATIWGLLSGWRASGRSEANAAKGRLHQHLDKVVRAARTNYARGTEEIYRVLEKSLREQADLFAARKRSEAEAELARIQDEDRMTQQQRADEAKKLEGQIVEWRKLGEEFAVVRGQLGRLLDWLSQRAGRAS